MCEVKGGGGALEYATCMSIKSIEFWRDMEVLYSLTATVLFSTDVCIYMYILWTIGYDW